MRHVIPFMHLITNISILFDMVPKPTNAYKCLMSILYYIINIIWLLRVLATLMANLREVHYEGYNTKVFEPMHKSKIHY